MSDKYSEIEKAFSIYKSGREVEDKVPEGWFSATDYSKRGSCSIATAHRQIRMLCDKGHIETKTFRIRSGGRLYPVPHYKVAPSGKDACKPSPKRKQGR